MAAAAQMFLPLPMMCRELLKLSDTGSNRRWRAMSRMRLSKSMSLQDSLKRLRPGKPMARQRQSPASCARTSAAASPDISPAGPMNCLMAGCDACQDTFGLQRGRGSPRHRGRSTASGSPSQLAQWCPRNARGCCGSLVCEQVRRPCF